MSSSYDKTLRDHFGIQTTKHLSRKSSLLKDYLIDDLSSCSSNGFNSFPRQQYCCTTIGQRKKTINTTLPPKSNSTSSSSSKISALYRASEAVISTFKSFPLSQKNGAKAKKSATSFLSRSFSRKVLFSSRRFWKKGTKEKGIVKYGSSSTRRWMRYFRELVMEEGDKTTSNEDITFIVNVSATTNFSGSGSNKSWAESEFSFSSSERSAEKENVVESTKEVVASDKVEGAGEGVASRDWPNEEKEQFSPVSILDCPFEDDEEITSHFNSTTEGNKHVHNQKRRHFKSVASLEPVTLEEKMAQSDLEVETYESRSSLFPSSTLVPTMSTQNVTTNVLSDNIDEDVVDLLNFITISTPSNYLITKAENLLFDYFKQSIEENNNIDHSKKLHLCEVAEDWIIGQPQELYLGWEVKEGRHIYIREIDKEWKNSDQESQQVASELENELLTSLVNELVLDLTMQQASSSIVFSIL
ncbi:PREDICTED: uncharacterized protein LOC109340868 [Lupinus angustifolius]|uniref:uncharacterized protein LOC109340868 n=1 Tax=Lupinus angustifolius TaxID=3871 RepID=UPI00092EBBCB|nr:PREDICTED: uncharacterized protein LOC109340868 [Lupinus angustifolius]